MKKVGKVRELKPKVKIIREIDSEKEREKKVEDSINKEISQSFVSDNSAREFPTTNGAERIVSQNVTSRTPVQRREESGAELENQSRNFYTSGLAAREERRNYVSQAPRIVNAGGDNSLRRGPAPISNSADPILNDSSRAVDSGGEIRYYEFGSEEKPRRRE